MQQLVTTQKAERGAKNRNFFKNKIPMLQNKLFLINTSLLTWACLRGCGWATCISSCVCVCDHVTLTTGNTCAELKALASSSQSECPRHFRELPLGPQVPALHLQSAVYRREKTNSAHLLMLLPLTGPLFVPLWCQQCGGREEWRGRIWRGGWRDSQRIRWVLSRTGWKKEHHHNQNICVCGGRGTHLSHQTYFGSDIKTYWQHIDQPVNFSQGLFETCWLRRRLPPSTPKFPYDKHFTPKTTHTGNWQTNHVQKSHTHIHVPTVQCSLSAAIFAIFRDLIDHITWSIIHL